LHHRGLLGGWFACSLKQETVRLFEIVLCCFGRARRLPGESIQRKKVADQLGDFSVETLVFADS